MKGYVSFMNGLIRKRLLYAGDVVQEVQKYVDEMDMYYSNLDNTYKDEKSYNTYCKFKKECIKRAKERGIIK